MNHKHADGKTEYCETGSQGRYQGKITAYSKEDVVKAADLMAKGWKNHQIKRIHSVKEQRPGNPELISYYVLMWN